MAVYSSGSKLKWREVEGGELPSPREGLRASLLDDILYMTGGTNGTELGSILSWDPVGEFWQPVGNLAVARFYHAVLAVPTSTVNLYCTKKMEFNKIDKDSPLFCMFSHVQRTESPKMYLTRYHHI